MDAAEELKDLKTGVKDALVHLRVSALSGAADIAKWIFAALLTINSGALLGFADDKSIEPAGLVLFVVGIVSAVISGFLFWLTLASAAFVVFQSEILAKQILLRSILSSISKESNASDSNPFGEQAAVLGKSFGYSFALMLAGVLAWVASLACFVLGTLISLSLIS